MLHHIYSVQAPANEKDAKSWFEYYKFRPEDDDELYVVAPDTKEISEGDVIWFELNLKIYGAVKVLRVTEDHVNGRKELWYRGTDIRPLSEPVGMSPTWHQMIVSGLFWEGLNEATNEGTSR